MTWIYCFLTWAPHIVETLWNDPRINVMTNDNISSNLTQGTKKCRHPNPFNIIYQEPQKKSTCWYPRPQKWFPYLNDQHIDVSVTPHSTLPQVRNPVPLALVARKIPCSPTGSRFSCKIHSFCFSYGHLSVISTYNPIYRMYNPIYNHL
jgi:hypothetical protein